MTNGPSIQKQLQITGGFLDYRYHIEELFCLLLSQLNWNNFRTDFNHPDHRFNSSMAQMIKYKSAYHRYLNLHNFVRQKDLEILPIVRYSNFFSRLAFSLSLYLLYSFLEVSHHYMRFRCMFSCFFRCGILCQIFVQDK